RDRSMSMRSAIMRAGLETLYFSGAHMMMRPFVGGGGAILMLHHGRPARRESFQPNAQLALTPAFFERPIRRLRRAQADLISLAAMPSRLTERDFKRRFACITFDDGYRDTAEFAYPILKAAGAPFCIYVASSFPDRLGKLWWLALEAVIARNARFRLMMDGEERRVECPDAASKREGFDTLYWWLRGLPSDKMVVDTVADLAARHGVDMAAVCAALC